MANMVEYENFLEFIAKSYGGDKKSKPEEYKKRSAELNYKNLTMPIAITTGGKDTSVPPASALRLVKLLQGVNPKNVLSIHRENTGHSTDYKDTAEAVEFVVNKAIKQ